MALSNYMKAFIQDVVFRGQNGTLNGKTLSWSAAPTLYVGLIGGSLFPNQGFAMRSTAYTVGQYAWPATPNGRLYKCTTAGTTGASEPSWPTAATAVDGQTITDGGVVWTDQIPAMEAGTVPEPSGNNYARQSWTCSLAAVMGTNLAASASASSGAGGTVANLNAIQFPVATPGAWGPIWGLAFWDASSAGNLCHIYNLTVPKVVGINDQMTFAAGTANTTYGAVQVNVD